MFWIEPKRRRDLRRAKQKQLLHKVVHSTKHFLASEKRELPALAWNSFLLNALTKTTRSQLLVKARRSRVCVVVRKPYCCQEVLQVPLSTPVAVFHKLHLVKYPTQSRLLAFALTSAFTCLPRLQGLPYPVLLASSSAKHDLVKARFAVPRPALKLICNLDRA